MAAISDLDPLTLVLGAGCFSLTLLCIAYPDRYATTNPRPDLRGPNGMPVIGNLLQAVVHYRYMIHWFRSLQNDYGPVSTFTFPPWGRGIFITQPEWLLHVKQGAFCIPLSDVFN